MHDLVAVWPRVRLEPDGAILTCQDHGGRYLDPHRGCCRLAGAVHRGRVIADSRRYQSPLRLHARRAQQFAAAARVERTAPML
jgi:hypothetical protein